MIMNRLDKAHQKTLLSLARRTLETWTRTQEYPDESELAPFSGDPLLNEWGATFVSLHEGGMLRGCIGTLEPVEPLYQSVIRNTVNAASSDPRFPEVRAAEVPAIDIEISVLSGYETVSGPQDVVIGVHGLLLELGHARGLLLPQVAPEYRWTPEQFLEHTAQKAGLPWQAWKTAKVSRFQAQVFGEKEK